MKELNQYHKDTIQKFLTEILEIDIDIAKTDADIISTSISNTTTTKLAHFLDCILQYSTGYSEKSCSKSATCGSCCGNCNCKS